MKFNVVFAEDPKVTVRFADGSRFKIHDNGVLEIRSLDKVTTFYAASAWVSVSHATKEGANVAFM
jgi:hypothetical protein